MIVNMHDIDDFTNVINDKKNSTIIADMVPSDWPNPNSPNNNYPISLNSKFP